VLSGDDRDSDSLAKQISYTTAGFFFATPTLTSPYYVTLGTFEMIEIYSIKANLDYFFLLSVRR